MAKDKALQQRIENMNLMLLRNTGHHTGIDYSNAFFKECQDVLLSLCENEALFSLFSTEVHQVLEKLEVIRKVYANGEERHADLLTREIVTEVSNTIQGIKTSIAITEGQYDHEHLQDTIISLGEEIHRLEQTKEKLSEQIHSMPIIQNEAIIKIMVRTLPKKDLDVLFKGDLNKLLEAGSNEPPTLLGGNMSNKMRTFGKDLVLDYQRLLKKDNLENKKDMVENKLTALKHSLQLLSKSQDKTLDKPNDDTDNAEQQSTLQARF